ncbi:ABC transporter permease subunit [Mesobacillus subterraneus]|uniref:ABC transporter permease subunit n=1 Tax=Mesobacillus subterraneus TaxID=285983 RepID=UPI001CFD45F2|nr:ABC transporter permease subunit [Mesobacillus subterraneus]
MQLIFKLGKLLFMWIFVAVFLILLVMMPRGNPDIDHSLSRQEMTDQYGEQMQTLQRETYKENIRQTFKNAIVDKSLGQTVHLLSVEEEVWRFFKKSLVLLIPSLFISLIFGVIKGIFDFRFSKGLASLPGQRTTSLLLSMPDFFVIISVQIGLMILVTYGFPHIDVYGSETLSNKLLGIFFLSMYPLVYIARVTQSVLQAEAGMDYIRTAKSKGTSPNKIIFIHMLGNGWLKILSHLNTITLYLLSNLFIVEFLTGYRGGAYRFFRAFEVKPVFTIGAKMEIEIPIIIEYILIFTFIVLLSQMASTIASDRQLRKEGNEV